MGAIQLCSAFFLEDRDPHWFQAGQFSFSRKFLKGGILHLCSNTIIEGYLSSAAK